MSELEHEQEREDGIQAIIALQAVVGIEETYSVAASNWDRFTPEEKRSTMAWAKFLHSKEQGANVLG